MKNISYLTHLAGASFWQDSNAMYRLKQLFGTRLSVRLFATQNTEVRARIFAMNTMTYLGMPKSVRVGEIFS